MDIDDSQISRRFTIFLNLKNLCISSIMRT